MARTHALDADEYLTLEEQHGEYVHRFVFQVVDDGAMVNSFTVNARIKGLATAELITVPYTNRATGASVAAGTAIAAEGLFEVDATGVEIVLNNNYTSGAGTVHYYDVTG